MQKNFQALLKRPYRLLIFTALFITVVFLIAQEGAPDENNFSYTEIIPDDQYSNADPPVEVQWYRSNASGMQLELSSSKLAALRNEYSLSTEGANLMDTPELIREYYEDAFTVELRTLYKDGKTFRLQWLFRDIEGAVRLVASGNGPRFGMPEIKLDDEDAEAPLGSGFIELQNGDGAVTLERRFDDDASEWELRFFYENTILVKVETWFKPAPAPVPQEIVEVDDNEAPIEIGEDDNDIPYSDDLALPEITTPEHEADTLQDATLLGNLDTVEEENTSTENISVENIPAENARTENTRTENTPEENTATEVPVIMSVPEFAIAYTDHYRYNRSGGIRAVERVFGEGADAAVNAARVAFPRLGPDISATEELGVIATIQLPEFLWDTRSLEGIKITYSLDERGRVVNELWTDEEGTVVGEYQYTWAGDRLASLLWITEDEERLVEYDHDAEGKRIAERNFRQGVLEREVRTEDGIDIEEIFLNGRLVLRAQWEDGLKISEERISQAGRNR